MISHKYKCIFIHIQRTAGTSIEDWVYGKDWWDVHKHTKHLLASQAKQIYKEYWDEYFKFSFVRNPWDRTVSMLRFKNFFGVDVNNNGIININRHKNRNGFPFTVEKRFNKYDHLIDDSNHEEYCVYGNILDEELDFVGRFENLYEDLEYIRDRLKIEKPFNKDKKEAKTKNRKENYRKHYDETAKNEVYDLYYKDIIKYNYHF